MYLNAQGIFTPNTLVQSKHAVQYHEHEGLFRAIKSARETTRYLSCRYTHYSALYLSSHECNGRNHL